MKVYCQVPLLGPGRLFFGARPGRIEDVQDFDGVLCLLERHEIQELGLQWLQAWHLPIPDRGVPRDLGASFQKSVDLLQFGGRLLVHCRAGIGRSALITGCLVAQLEPHRRAGEIWQALSSARGLQVPDTEEQREWLQQFIRSSKAPKSLEEALASLLDE